MKKNVKHIISAILIAASVFSFAGCKKDSTPASSSSVSSVSSSAESSSSEDKSSADTSSSADVSSSDSQKMDELKFNIGNDMGKSISALEIKPEKNNSWTEIALDKTWESGYMIPVTLSAKEIPADEKWEAKITFADDKTEQTFNDITINENSSIILTADGVVYGK